jgi:hypothetical protein
VNQDHPWHPTFTRIQNFGRLPDGWDGRDAPPIKSNVRWSAARLCSVLVGLRVSPPQRCRPDPDGSIVLEWISQAAEMVFQVVDDEMVLLDWRTTGLNVQGSLTITGTAAPILIGEPAAPVDPSRLPSQSFDQVFGPMMAGLPTDPETIEQVRLALEAQDRERGVGIRAGVAMIRPSDQEID